MDHPKNASWPSQTPSTAAEATALRANGLSPKGRYFNTPFVLRLSKHERASGPVTAVFRIVRLAHLSQEETGKLVVSHGCHPRETLAVLGAISEYRLHG